LYEIRLCKFDEIDLLINFLKNSWSQNHIFLKNKDILNFQHKSLDEYNFIVAYHIETKCFHGVLGIISPDFYIDRKINKNQDLWLAIWKVEKSISKSGSLGMDMLYYLETEFEPKSISAIGVNETVTLLYKAIGFKTKKMKQWFIPNRNFVDHKLITGDLPASVNLGSNPSYKIIECKAEQENIIDFFLSSIKSKKSFRYLLERYLNHPIYKYKIYAFLKSELEIHALVVGRKVMAKGVSAFRITDFFVEHEVLLNLSYSFEEILKKGAYEYIDFLEYGFDELSLKNCGFIKCVDSLYVPNLFEPFVAGHMEVKIAYRSKLPFSCTKGDSDLDRPNQN